MIGRVIEFCGSLVWPRRCALCGRLDRPLICDDCGAEFAEVAEPRRLPAGSDLDVVHSVYAYEGSAGEMVRRLKYARATGLAPTMAREMAEARERSKLPLHDLMVPVPIHWSRRFARGFNQSELLMQDIPDLERSTTALRRVRSTRPQVHLDRSERLTHLRGAFAATPEVEGRRVLLIDDVITTGGTLFECAKTLRGAGAVWVGALTYCMSRPDELDQSSGESKP